MNTLYSKPVSEALIHRSIRDMTEAATPPKAVAVIGPGCIGKTTLLKTITQCHPTSWYSGDDPKTIAVLKFRTQSDVIRALTAAPYLVIDQAHKIPDIGTIVKILVDINEHLENPCRIFVSSASAIAALPGKESAVGRVATRQMWPFSVYEIAEQFGWESLERFMERFLVYGLMPLPTLNADQAREFLDDYCAGPLLKGFCDLYPEKNPSLVSKILIRLAQDMGSEISYGNLAQEIGISPTDLEDYVLKLQACSIIRICPFFSKNPATETKHGNKIYLFDNGVRNALIHDFSPMSSRSDAGALWENFFFMERIKLHDTLRDFKLMYFWRTTGPYPREIDFLEVLNGSIEAFECKLSDKIDTTRHASFFEEKYPGSTISVVRPGDCMRVFRESYSTPKKEDQELSAYLQALRAARK